MAGVIVRMNSKKFIKKFIEDKDVILQDFNYVLVSEEINSNNTHQNVVRARALIPRGTDISFRISGHIQRYYDNYMAYLATPEPLHLLVTMVAGVIKSDLNVVLLCSKSEDENSYLSIIDEFLEKNFGIRAYTYEEYKEDTEACKNIPDIARTKKALQNAIGFLKKAREDNQKLQDKKDKEKVKAELKEMKRKELKEICKEYGIKINKDDEKKELIKKILKAMF